MRPTFWKPLVVAVSSAAMVLAVLYIAYRWVDPLPPRHLTIAAGPAESGYDNSARQYARMLTRDGVELEVGNSTGAVEDLNLLRDAGAGVQVALTTFGVTQPSDIYLLQEFRADHSICATAWQTPFHWQTGNRLTIACLAGSKSL